MTQPDQQPEMPPAGNPAPQNALAGTSSAPGEADVIASLVHKLSAQPALAVPTLLGTDLPLLASQVAAVHSYQHAYGSASESLSHHSAAPLIGPTAKAMLITDHSAKPAGPSPDASTAKNVPLKRRKVNANRFRARPNKPPE
jgi:hypothetical protein